MPLPEISAAELRFVEEYCKDRNGTRAALAAGLTADPARAADVAHDAARKPDIKVWIRHVFRLQARRLKTEVPDVVREWAVMGKSDITDYTVDDKGRVDVLPGVPRVALRAVKKVKTTRTMRLSGKGEDAALVEEVRVEIELHDKNTPLAKLYDHLHGALPGDAKPAGGMTIDDAVRLRDDLARLARVGSNVPGAVPVVPEGGAAVGGVPEPG